MTNNIFRRFREHVKGIGASYTRKHGANKLIYFEAHNTRSEAFRKEKEIKKWNHYSKKALALGILKEPIYHNGI
jgi:putative endonuclease